MKRISLLLFTVAATLILPIAAAATMVDTIFEYNAVVFNDYTSANSDVEGRLAVGGTANLTSYGVGSRLPAGTTGDVLSVGGELFGTNGQVYYGDATVGGNANLTSFNVQGDLKANTSPDFDFAAMEAAAKGLSSSFASLVATGTTTYQWGGTYLTGSDQDMVVFDVSGSELGGSWGAVLDSVGDDSTIIINVSDQIINLANMGLSSLVNFSDRILFNFYEAESLSLTGLTINGTVLAPYATVTGTNGSIYGSLIASSFDSSIELEYNLFRGNPPTTAVPEPSTIALLALGLIGLMVFARRRQTA